MGKINVLSFEVANLIAAGEVVERPASVVKELVENSIDAGAKEIIAEIKRGGVVMIRVTDDGCGISKEDLPIALKRHATSKINDKNDLDGITTLGFRGEALAAISSVSNVTIISRAEDAETATMMTAEAGQVTDVSDVYSHKGTTIVVSDLFANVPARRKFLKKDSTEALNVIALMERVALSRPDIAFKLIVDGEERFSTYGDGKLGNAIKAIHGKSYASKMIEVLGEANGVRVSGFIGRSDNVKKNRNQMNVFINGRYVKSLTVQAAIERGYTSFIAPDAFPTCVLFLEVNHSMVDVNVHPAKLEVKFSDEKAVFETVYYTVKNALETSEYRPEFEFAGKKSKPNLIGAFVPIGADTSGEQLTIKAPTASVEPIAEISGSTPARTPSYEYSYLDYSPVMKVGSASSQGVDQSDNKPLIDMSVYDKIPDKPEALFPDPPKEQHSYGYEAYKEVQRYKNPELLFCDPSFRYVGEIYNCYLIVEYKREAYIIDKHAAHERLIFEDLKKQLERDGSLATQRIFDFDPIDITPNEKAVAKDYKEEISRIGYEYRVVGQKLYLDAHPTGVEALDAYNFLKTLLSDLIEGSGNAKIDLDIFREKSLYQIACKSAIKANKKYGDEITRWLIARVLDHPSLKVCPHGRPVVFVLKKSAIEKQFERI